MVATSFESHRRLRRPELPGYRVLERSTVSGDGQRGWRHVHHSDLARRRRICCVLFGGVLLHTSRFLRFLRYARPMIVVQLMVCLVFLHRGELQH